MTQKRLMQFLDFHTTYVPQQLSLLTVSHDDYLVVEVEHDKGLLVLLRPSRLRRGEGWSHHLGDKGRGTQDRQASLRNFSEIHRIVCWTFLLFHFCGSSVRVTEGPTVPVSTWSPALLRPRLSLVAWHWFRHTHLH